jgi:hypothetical protein
MNWILTCNESEEDEWSATTLGQDNFTKSKEIEKENINKKFI